MNNPELPLELVTSANFDDVRYMKANPDVALFVQNGGSAREHFEDYGRSEGRKQVVAGFSHSRADLRRAKYRRFKNVLSPSNGHRGEFRFLDQRDSFPVSYGESLNAIEEYDRESANNGFSDFIAEIDANPEGLYLDVGCGYRRSTQENCLYLEVYPSASADIIMEPFCAYPIASGSLDGIGCFAVLEHVTEPWLVANEFRRMLKPGGKVFIDWPFLQPVHGYPSHYYNATRAGLKRMFEDGFDLLELATLDNQTPDHTVSWLLRGWMDSLTDEAVRQSVMNMTVAQIVAEAPGSALWKSVIAVTPAEDIMTYACGNTLIARKL